MLAEPRDRFKSSTAFSTSSGLFSLLVCLLCCSGVRLKADLGDGLVGVGGLRIGSGGLKVNSRISGGLSGKIDCIDCIDCNSRSMSC